jgi:hypothetical protein
MYIGIFIAISVLIVIIYEIKNAPVLTQEEDEFLEEYDRKNRYK